MSVLMIDLDHFKRVNDRWGHACGDIVLTATSNALRDSLRGADMAARYGGEEFLAILPVTDKAQALDVAERIRANIALLRIPTSDDVIQITASIGIATLIPGELQSSLIVRADKALYRAKQEGRDRCISSDLRAFEAPDAAS